MNYSEKMRRQEAFITVAKANEEKYKNEPPKAEEEYLSTPLIGMWGAYLKISEGR